MLIALLDLIVGYLLMKRWRLIAEVRLLAHLASVEVRKHQYCQQLGFDIIGSNNNISIGRWLYSRT